MLEVEDNQREPHQNRGPREHRPVRDPSGGLPGRAESAHAPHWTGVVGGRVSSHPLSPGDDPLPPGGEHPPQSDAHHVGLGREHSGSAPGSELAPLQRLTERVRRCRRRGDSVCAARYPQPGGPPLPAGDAAASARPAGVAPPASPAQPHRPLGISLREVSVRRHLPVSVARASEAAHSRDEFKRGLPVRLHARRAAHAAATAGGTLPFRSDPRRVGDGADGRHRVVGVSRFFSAARIAGTGCRGRPRSVRSHRVHRRRCIRQPGSAHVPQPRAVVAGARGAPATGRPGRRRTVDTCPRGRGANF